MAMIVLDHVTKYYGSHAAVRDLDFRIEQGECVGFLGLNGSGKTTTLRLLSCQLLPTSGRITVRGLDAESQPHEIRKLLGYLPDRPPVYPEMSVREFVRFAGSLRRMDRAALARRLPEVLDTAGLTEVADDVIQTLSHGFKQRVGIAQAIIHDPALLILDEPIQGLDPVQIVEMRAMIRKLRGRHTILLSTHILAEIQQTCDRILMLHEGHISAQGTEQELAERFGDRRSIELVARASASELRDLLSGLPGTLEVEVEPAEGDSSRARIITGDDLREAAARAVVQAGFGLLSLGQRRTGLEGVFVELSKSGDGPAEAA